MGYYNPGTFVTKPTYQDPSSITANTNPIALDSRGQAIVWGSGTYRQIVKDVLGATIWDRTVSSSVGSDELAATGGAALVGYNGSTLAQYLSTIAATVLSIAALRALSKTSVQEAAVLGYYSSGDGGGGIYWYDASDNSTVDNGGTVIVAADGGRWKLTTSQILSARQFGAIGDGNTDDSAAIRAGAVATAALGKTLFFPAGNYRLLSSIAWASGTSWQGELGTKIYLDPNMTLGASIGGSARGIYASSITGLKLRGITFYSTKTGLSQSISIAVVGVAGIDISECVFSDFGDSTHYAQGFTIFSSTNMRIINNQFTRCSGDGAAMSNSCIDWRVDGNEFSDCGDWGFAVTIGCKHGVITNNRFLRNTSTATGVDRCQEIVISNNIMISNSYGVRVTKFAATPEINQDITISGNVIRDVLVAGVSVEQASGNGFINVTGNTILGSQNQGILVVDASCVSVTGNSIYSTSDAAILFNAQTAGLETGRATVVGNKASTCTYGLRQITAAGTSSKITVIGNNFTECSIVAVNVINADVINADDGAFFGINKPLNFPSGYVAGSATGGGLVPPSNVQGYIPVYLSGAQYKIPFYNA